MPWQWWSMHGQPVYGSSVDLVHLGFHGLSLWGRLTRDFTQEGTTCQCRWLWKPISNIWKNNGVFTKFWFTGQYVYIIILSCVFFLDEPISFIKVPQHTWPMFHILSVYLLAIQHSQPQPTQNAHFMCLYCT